MFQSELRVDIPGVNFYALSPEEVRFVKSKLLESFHAVATRLGYSGVSNYLVDVPAGKAGSGSVGEGEDETRRREQWKEFVDDIMCGVTVDAGDKKSRPSDLIPDIPDHVITTLNRFHRETCAALGLDCPLRVKHCFWIMANPTRQQQQQEEQVSHKLRVCGYCLIRSFRRNLNPS